MVSSRRCGRSSQPIHKNVLYFGGDTHTPRVDHPLTDVYPSPTQLATTGMPYPNSTRLEVYAQTTAFTDWFKSVGIGPTAYLGNVGCPAWIRTMTKASKGPCATVTPPDMPLEKLSIGSK